METLSDKILRSQVNLQVSAMDRLEKMAPASDQSDAAGEEGSTTVEYAIGAVATAAFAGLLLAVLKSGGVKALLNGIISSALSI